MSAQWHPVSRRFVEINRPPIEGEILLVWLAGVGNGRNRVDALQNRDMYVVSRVCSQKWMIYDWMNEWTNEWCRSLLGVGHCCWLDNGAKVRVIIKWYGLRITHYHIRQTRISGLLHPGGGSFVPVTPFNKQFIRNINIQETLALP